MATSRKPRLLCLSSGDPLTLRPVVEAMKVHFEVHVSNSPAAAAREVRMLAPKLVCFDFGAPTSAELRAMQRLKQTQASLPVLMLTEAHSEELAVWSFRVRVWNYLVKPVEPDELAENLRILATLVRSAGGRRVPQQLVGTRVPEIAPTLFAGRQNVAVLNALREIEARHAEPLRAADLAASVGLSPFEFSRAFRAQCGTSYREFLLRHRIEQARRLLEQGAMDVTRVGYAVGINDPSRFAAQFRRIVGQRPSAYRDAQQARRRGSRG